MYATNIVRSILGVICKCTSCYRSANKLLQICPQAVNKLCWLLTTCNKLDGIIRLVTRLFQQDRYRRYSHDVTRLLQDGRYKVVTILSYLDCIRLVRTSCSTLSSCSKLVDNLGRAVRTQLVDGLLAGRLAIQDVTANVGNLNNVLSVIFYSSRTKKAANKN